ncbi:MAG: DUF3426 domain-containing protein [Candidatus Deferrimicrobiaceae bacterium]
MDIIVYGCRCQCILFGPHLPCRENFPFENFSRPLPESAARVLLSPRSFRIIGFSSNRSRTAMSMVIECDACRSRFRISTALFQGARAARVRCRTCGKPIMVANLEMPNPRPALRPEPKPDPDPPPGPQRRTSPGPVPTSPPATAPPKKETVPPLEGAVMPLPVERPTPRSSKAPVPTSWPATEPPKKETVPLEGAVLLLPVDRPIPRGGRRPFHTRPSFFIAAFLLLLFAGGATYFGFTTAGQGQLPRLFPGWGSLTAGTATASPGYDIGNVEGYFTRKAGGGTRFVLKGTVGNAGKSRDGKIRVRAILLDNQSQPLAETVVYAGNLLDERLLPRMDREEIESAMASVPPGNASKNIPPGEALPFTVVFVDPPDTMVSSRVTAFDAK